MFVAVSNSKCQPERQSLADPVRNFMIPTIIWVKVIINQL